MIRELGRLRQEDRIGYILPGQEQSASPHTCKSEYSEQVLNGRGEENTKR